MVSKSMSETVQVWKYLTSLLTRVVFAFSNAAFASVPVALLVVLTELLVL